MDTIVNKVEESGLVQLDLETFKPHLSRQEYREQQSAANDL